MLGFSGLVDWSSITHTELMTLLTDISLCWDEGFWKIKCFTDSLETIRLHKEANTIFHLLYGNEVALLRDLLNRDWEMHIKHTYREGKFCADRFANMGARSDSALIICRNPPTDLRPL